MKSLSDYTDEELILFTNATDRDQVIETMVSKLDELDKLPDPAGFLKAIFEREKLVSTGIGMGVALPHAKMSSLEDFFIAVAILQKGVDWHSLDRASVRIVIMIGGPDDKQTEYLQLLSRLTLLIKNEEIRKKLLTSNSAIDIIKLFKAN